MQKALRYALRARAHAVHVDISERIDTLRLFMSTDNHNCHGLVGTIRDTTGDRGMQVPVVLEAARGYASEPADTGRRR